MDTLELKDRAMTPPADTKPTPLTAPYRKDFSLTSAAKFLGIGKGTLKRAIERGDVKATTNAAGHYTIEGSQVFQYQSNLEADRMSDAPTRASTGVDTSAGTGSDTPSTKGVIGGVSTGVDTPSGTGRDTPADRRAGTVSADLHVAVKEALEARLRDKDGAIRRLENDVAMWQEQSKSWENQAGSNQRLLTDEREKIAQYQTTVEQGGGSNKRTILVFSAVAALLILGYFFRTDIANTIAKFTVSEASVPAVATAELPQN